MIREKIKASKGFLTAKGRIIDFKEWHTVSSSVAAMYLSPKVWAVFTGFILIEEKRRHGSLAEYRQELPYWLMFGLVTGLAFGFTGRLDASLISFVTTLP